MRLAWGKKVSPEFCLKAWALCARLRIPDPSWLMACVAFETGETFSPAVRNAESGATGLIQFMPSTARSLGTSVEALARMTAEEQLDWVERYFQPYTGKIATLADCYMAILWPKAVEQPDDFPLFSGGSAYAMNKGLDANKDHVVTKTEAAAYVQAKLERGLRDGFVEELEVTQEPAPIEERGTPYVPPVAEPPAAQPYNPEQEAPMPAPLIGLALTLLPEVLKLFAPRAQKQLERVTGAPPEVAQQFTQDVFAKIGQTLAVPAPLENPVAAVAALQAAPPEKVREVEEHALSYLDKLLPVFDRLAEQDKWLRQAQVEGQNAAMLRQQAAEPGAVQVVVKNVNGMSWAVLGGLIVAIVAAVICKGIFKDDMPDYITMLVALAGPLFGQIMKERGAIVAYYFDGTPSSNAVNAINAQLAKIGKEERP